MTVNILGTEYTIHEDNANDPEMKDKWGYCFTDAKEIHIIDFDTEDEYKKESPEVRKRRTDITLRHEIIHAFLIESGLNQNSMETDCWAKNEEMVDWFAIQFPKILKAFEGAGCI